MEGDIKGAIGADGFWLEEPIKERHFTYRSFFEKFITEVHSIIMKCMRKYPYNSMTSMVKYYESFKKQELPLMEYYEKRHRPYIAMDSQNCVGKALHLRRKLLKHLSDQYHDLEENLYLVTCNEYNGCNGADIPEKYLEELPVQTLFYKDHVCLVLKFTLERTRRRGYLVMDHAYLLDFPVVVMEDALPPHTGQFVTSGRNLEGMYELIYHSENYIFWNMRVNEDAEAKDQRNLRNRFFFVGKKLGNVCQIAKRNQMYLFHAFSYCGVSGPIAAAYTILGQKDHFVAFVPDVNLAAEDSLGYNVNTSKRITVEIPFNYVLSDDFPTSSTGTNANAEWDFVLKELNRRYQRSYPGGSVLVILKRFARLATDSDFLSEITSVHNAWSNTIENSFLN